ncbi:MAG: hypothetical protein NUV73_00690 [Candidatus Daviesbacteria bacterium]|nr:hypothetical protein [Candidatus Daviesbacteria bacterium]
MPKKILLLIIFLLIQLGLPLHPALAAQNCKDLKISGEPGIFLAGETQFILNFTSKDPNVTNNLKGKYVRLLIDQGAFTLSGTYTNPPVKVDGANFSFALTGDLTKQGLHEGIMQWSTAENGPFDDFCQNIAYQVGVGSTNDCKIADQSVPNKIPPDSSLTVKFVGQANSDYELYINGKSYGSLKTDSNGQGQFSPVKIPGKIGDLVAVGAHNVSRPAFSCSKETRIDASAGAPAPVPSGSVQPGLPRAIEKHCVEGKNPDELKEDEMLCNSAGGKKVPGCTDDPNNPAIATAIGCIHTNPVEFTKDLMKFVIGISGGLAFLMMLLGAFQILSSADNPDTLKAGRERLTSAVIGLLIVIFAILLLQIIGVGILAIPGFKP